MVLGQMERMMLDGCQGQAKRIAMDGLVQLGEAFAGVTDWSALGFHTGGFVCDGVPVLENLPGRPSLDELDALCAAMATSGGVALFIVPGVNATLCRQDPRRVTYAVRRLAAT